MAGTHKAWVWIGGAWQWMDTPDTPPPQTLVNSVFGRTGTVVAQVGDYSFSQITGPLDAGTY